jgi:hypothetical protein
MAGRAAAANVVRRDGGEIERRRSFPKMTFTDLAFTKTSRRYMAEEIARRREISKLIRVARTLGSIRLQARRQKLEQIGAYQLLFNSSKTNLTPKNRWCNSDMFSKHAVQLGCIAKPHRERHVVNRQIAI